MRVGGSEIAGGGSKGGIKFQHDFLEHCLRGTNYATGKTGTPIDFISFHAKGSPKFVDGHVQMGISNQLNDIDKGFATVAAFPELKDTPIVIGESDPDGCAACAASVYPQNNYRHSPQYASYTAACISREFDLADKHGINFLGLTWAFEFEDQPIFGGFRRLATDGLPLPVMNVFRMFSQMQGERIEAESSASLPLETMLSKGVRDAADVSALATLGDHKLCVMVWNYHDDDVPAPPAEVTLELSGLPDVGSMKLVHDRIDDEHSDVFTAWKRMGSPANPTGEQYQQLMKASELQQIDDAKSVVVSDRKAEVKFLLPRQGVSLLVLSWVPKHSLPLPLYSRERGGERVLQQRSHGKNAPSPPALSLRTGRGSSRLSTISSLSGWRQSTDRRTLFLRVAAVVQHLRKCLRQGASGSGPPQRFSAWVVS